MKKMIEDKNTPLVFKLDDDELARIAGGKDDGGEYRCPTCKIRFETKAALKSHIQGSHK